MDPLVAVAKIKRTSRRRSRRGLGGRGCYCCCRGGRGWRGSLAALGTSTAGLESRHQRRLPIGVRGLHAVVRRLFNLA